MTRRAAIRLTGVAAVLTLALAVSLTACGGADPSSAPAAKSPSFAAASSHGLELTDGWVSAAGDMGDMPGMTMSSGSMSGMDMDGSGAGEATASSIASNAATTSAPPRTGARNAAGQRARRSRTIYSACATTGRPPRWPRACPAPTRPQRRSSTRTTA